MKPKAQAQQGAPERVSILTQGGLDSPAGGPIGIIRVYSTNEIIILMVNPSYYSIARTHTYASSSTYYIIYIWPLYIL